MFSTPVETSLSKVASKQLGASSPADDRDELDSWPDYAGRELDDLDSSSTSSSSSLRSSTMESQSHLSLDSLSTSSTATISTVSSVTPPKGKARGRNPFLYPQNDTVQELRPEEIRWFYKETTAKKLFPFIGYDSLRIECKYRELRERKGTGQEPENADSENERIVVRGGLYEVDVAKRKCYPIYWTAAGHMAAVMRGTWFVDGSWQPLEEGYADQIETEHIAKFDKQKIPVEKKTSEGAKGPLSVLHNIKFTEFFVDWNAINQVVMHSETKSSKLYRAVGTKLGLAKSGTKLKRGYTYEAGMDDKPPDITHLIFVVHGIGQKMDMGSIVNKCAALRETCKKMKDKHVKSLDLDNKRVEFLPVEWRSSLKLDGDIVDSITPNKVRGLRMMLNSSAMDILYYTSPLYRSEITQALQTELNRLYTMFCLRHPYFEASGGKVSIVGHSLGSVITYDIITGWNPIQLYDQYVSSYLSDQKNEDGIPLSCQSRGSTIVGNQIYFSLHPDVEETCQHLENASELVSQLEDARKKVNDLEGELMKRAQKQNLKTPTLKFKLENFFCVGSPLAVFLALRGVRPKGKGTQDHLLPKTLCNRLFNIYHPSDPVAYRLEPLILKHYSTIMPLRIHHQEATKKCSYDQMPSLAYAALKSTGKSEEEVKKKDDKQSSKKSDTKVVKMEDDGGPQGKESGLIPILERMITGPDDVLSDQNLIDLIKEIQRGWAYIFKKTSSKPDVMSAELAVLKKLDSEDNMVLPPPLVVEEEDEEDEDLQMVALDTAAESDDAEWVHIPGDARVSSNSSLGSPDEQTDLEYRLDYQMKERKMENSYISALTSHTGYWDNSDVALFLLTQIFPDYTEQTQTQVKVKAKS